MQLTLETHGESQGNLVIQSWEPGSVKISGESFPHHVLIHGGKTAEWAPADAAHPASEDFAQLVELQPEIILFGTGIQQTFPPIELMTEIMQQGIAFEVMDSAAACRTYNVLSTEQRRVAAAILIR